MNKIDNAWAVLKTLSSREQEAAADAILDYASAASGPELSDAQVRQVEQRLQDVDETTVSPAALRARIEKLFP